MKNMKAMLQKGISLLEVMLSISIIAVILVMATRYYEVAHTNDALNNMQEQVSAVEGAVTRYADTHGSYADATITGLVEGSYYPNSTSYNAAGTGEIHNTLGTITLTSPSTTGITITVNMNGANKLCLRLAANLTGASCSDGILTMPLPVSNVTS